MLQRGFGRQAVLGAVALALAGCASAASTPVTPASNAPRTTTGSVPTTIGPGGVQLDQTGADGRAEGVEAYLYPAPGGAGLLTRADAVRAADVAGGGGPVTAAVLARVTLPETVPPPGVAASGGEVRRRPAWVVETLLTPAQEHLAPCRPGTTCAPASATKAIAVIDARTGQTLASFQTN
ncbi:MAG TPA: hypothetical protein VKG43_01835 [Acidimicrobiales bacterium]|nr:hypothetical protein [Acidimicrobiales bacterium]